MSHAIFLSMSQRAALATLLLFTLAISACSRADSAPVPQEVVAGSSTTASATSAPPSDSILRLPVPLVATPDTVRGLYVSRWAAMGKAFNELVSIAKRTEVNALVIDVKDDRGFVLYRSDVPLARAIGADANNSEVLAISRNRIRAMLDTMRAHNIYPIARIVVAKDPLLAKNRPEWAIVRKSDGTPWKDRQGGLWLDAHQPEIWRYAADLALEAVSLGFSEVQLDYVRFPDEPGLMAEANFPLAAGRLRAEVIREQLGMVRSILEPTGVPFAIDVFGLTTSDTTDLGIGQRWEMFHDQADVVLPMVYPSHYAKGSYGIALPNAQPYAVITRALKAAQRRSEGFEGAAKIVPWYQDFTLGAPRYGASQVRDQIRAGSELGIHSWILWNPRSVYTVEALRTR